MNHPEAHSAVMQGVININQVVSVTGRSTARVHLILHPGEVVRALVDGYTPTFHWSDSPVCGAVSTRGWIDTPTDDPRPVCRTCRLRWEQLADRYVALAEPGTAQPTNRVEMRRRQPQWGRGAR